jgi:hypothetical protein
MEQIILLRAAFDAFTEEAHAHWEREEERMRLVDRFIDPALNLDGLLKQVFSMLRSEHESTLALEREMRRLTAAVELATSTSALDQPVMIGQRASN